MFGRLGACLALATLVVAGFVASSASAALPAEFGTRGEGAGQVEEPEGIAVDESGLLSDESAGDVYVVDTKNNRVDKFSPGGEFLLAWGWGVSDGKAELEVCTTTCRKGLAGDGAGELGGESADGIAVDSDPSSLSVGDVYVQDAENHRVEKFGPNGEFLLAWGWGVANGEAKLETCGPQASPATATCEEGSEGSEPGQFGNLRAAPRSLTVSPSGSVYAGDEDRVQEFSAAGALTAEVSLEGVGRIKGLAVNAAGDLYVLGNEADEGKGVHEFEVSGSTATEIHAGKLDPGAEAGDTAITLGAVGELFVDDGERGRMAEFSQAGVQLASFPVLNDEGAVRGLAFSTALDELYILDRTRVRLATTPPAGPLVESEQATPEPVGTATVRASIDPEGKLTEYHLDYGLQETGETETAPVTMSAKGFEPETIAVKLTGLTPGATYHFHLVASSASAPAGNAGAPQTFAELGAVAIESESVSHVTGATARLQAVINPLTLPTQYHFEYLSEAEFATNGNRWTGPDKPISAPEAEASAGSGAVGVPESVLIEGLTAGTTYHYRLVAHNACEPVAHPGHQCLVEGADDTFTTQSGEGPGLIDGRGWEMVSPPDKHGVTLEAMTPEGGAIQAAAGGDGIAYIAKGPVDAEPHGNRSFAEQELLAGHGESGWRTQDVATPHEAVAPLGGHGMSEYKLFSPDLSNAFVEPEGATPLSPQAGERTAYLRHDAACESTSTEAIPPSCYTPLVNPGNDTAHTKFGLEQELGEWVLGTGVEVDTATPDGADAIVQAPQSLVDGFQASGEKDHESLYEWAAGALTPVSVLPGGASAATEGGASLGNADANMRNAISTDGERVFFQTEAQHHLYARDVGEERTVQLDVPEAGLPRPLSSPPAVYQDASSDGSRVFFTKAQRLTADSRAGELDAVSEPDLYMCELAAVAPGEADCSRHLEDLTVASTPDETADVLGAVIATSVDGAYVYFVANGILSSGGVPVARAVHGDCAVPTGQQLSAGESCNLYVWHEGATSLIAVVSNEDHPDWAGENAAQLTNLTARVSPDGGWLAFSSERSLTGYDNRDARSGEPDEEVYLYHAPGGLAGGSGSHPAGSLTCASCDPSGARPDGIHDPGKERPPALLVDRLGVWEERWLAGSVPGWTAVDTSVALYQSRYLNDEGRLFFDSSDGLVAADTNGRQDVYEFEPAGVGGCSGSTSSADAVFVKESASGPGSGCVGLISSGSSGEESAFLDASESGNDVFFLTAAKLAPQDLDDALDVYDAHVCGAGWTCPSGTVTVPPACTNPESCRAAPAPQPEIFGAAATATTGGSGNPSAPPPAVKPKAKPLTRAQKLKQALRACRKKTVRGKRESCERAAHKRYSPAKTRKANRSRRTGR